MPMPGTRLAWQYLPSRASGGDLFTVEPWGADTLVCCILDASGHGARAAARASLLADLLSAGGLHKQIATDDPGQILTVLNRRFPLTRDGQSVTIWLGSVSLASGTLRFSSAGHAGALVLRRAGAAEHVPRPSLPLGFAPRMRYSTVTTTLRLGDRLLMFSDGLYDAASPADERWGLKRFQRAVTHHARLPLAEHLAAVIAEGRAWQQCVRFDDDAAMVGLEIT